MKVILRDITDGSDYYEGEVNTAHFYFDVDVRWVSTRPNGTIVITTSKRYRVTYDSVDDSLWVDKEVDESREV